MSSRGNVGQSLPNTGTLQLPSIEITLEDDRAETGNRGESTPGNENAQPSGRLRHNRHTRHVSGLAKLRSKRGAVSIIPHLIIGLVLLAVGGVVRSILHSKPKITHPPSSPHASSPQLDQRLRNTSYPPLSLSGGRNDAEVVLLQSFFNPRHKDIEKPCEAVTCSRYLSLICITVGTMFMLCAISGALMVTYKMKEFVSCHLLWISLSTLCSVTLVASCVLGLKNSRIEREGISECISVIITASSVEIVFCLWDLYLMSGRAKQMQNNWQRWADSSRSGSRRDQVSHQRPVRHGESNSEHDNDSGENLVADGAISRRNPQQAVTGRRINNQRSGHNPRRRRSGQASRDRNSLHPGYHHQTRNRIRRRPILRAQNHYVLVPPAYGRSRAPSRVARRQSAARRNRVEIPMFVIANHDRYVQALNRSMETLETQPNRGSVPGDVLPSFAVIQSQRAKEIPRIPQKNALEKTDSLETTLSSSSIESSRVIRSPTSAASDAIAAPSMPQIQDNHRQHGRTEFPRALRGRSGYSIIRRTKEEFKVQSHQQSESETDAECSVSPNAFGLLSMQNTLPSMVGRPVSVMEDSVFHPPGLERSGSSQCMTDSEYSSRRKEKMKPSFCASTSRPRFYNATSEGDFANMANAREHPGGLAHTSGSSDSGIADAPHTAAKRIQRKHYHNFPMCVSPRVSLELSDFTASSPHFPHLPVSTLTPSYENLDS